MRNTKKFVGLLAGGMLAVTCSLAAKPASAATLAQYEFTGGSLASSDTDAGTVASNFGSGPGLPLRTSGFRGDPPPSAAATFASIGSTNKATALNLGTYYDFSIAPISGNKVNLTSFSFATNVGPTNLSTPVSGSYFARFSSDGVNFTDLGATYTQDATPFPNQNSAPGDRDIDFVTRNVDVSSISSSFFTAPVSFRIYEYKTGSSETAGGLRVDSVSVQGDVSPVPELSTGLLFGMAMLGMGFVAMRRKNGGAALGKSPFAI